MKDTRKLSQVAADLHLVADYFDLTLSYASHFHLVREVEADMRLKINHLLYVAL